jgi:hypothetical protein
MAAAVQVNIRSGRNFSFTGSLIFFAMYIIRSFSGLTVVYQFEKL